MCWKLLVSPRLHFYGIAKRHNFQLQVWRGLWWSKVGLLDASRRRKLLLKTLTMDEWMLCFPFCVEFDVKGADRLSSIDYFVGHGLFFFQRRVTVLQCVSPLAACRVHLFFLFSQGSCVKWVNCFTSHVSLQWHIMLLLCLLCPNMSVNARNQQGRKNKISVGRSSVTKKWIINHRSLLKLLHELVEKKLVCWLNLVAQSCGAGLWTVKWPIRIANGFVW